MPTAPGLSEPAPAESPQAAAPTPAIEPGGSNEAPARALVSPGAQNETAPQIERPATPPPTARAREVLERLGAQAGGYGGDLEGAARAMVERHGMSWDDAADLMVRVIGRSSSTYGIVEGIRDLVGRAEPGDAAAVRAALTFVAENSAGRMDTVLRAARELQVPVADMTLECLPQALARAVNELGAKAARGEGGYSTRYLAGTIAEAAYGMHEADVSAGRPRDQRIGERFTEALDARGAYVLLSARIAPNDAWIYQRIRDSFVGAIRRDGLTMAQWVSEHGANKELSEGVVNTLAQFNATDLLLEGGPVFLDRMLEMMTGHDKATHIARTLAFFDANYARLPAQSRATLENALVQSVRAPSSDDNPLARRAAAAYMLRHLHDAGKPLGAEAREAARGLPAMPSAAPAVDDWLADGVLTAHMVFYPNEVWFDETIRWARAQGFQRNNSRELRAAHGLRPNEVILDRERNGVIQRFIITQNDDKKPYQVPDDRTRLIVGGSCGSYGAMTDEMFLMRYGQNPLVADADTGEGAVNNAVMLQLMNGITDRHSDWARYRLHIHQHRAIKPPTDIGFRMGAYARAFVQATGEELGYDETAMREARRVHGSVDIFSHRGHAGDFHNTFALPERRRREAPATAPAMPEH